MLVVLQLVGTMASLYLPSLNAEIIDKGVAKGDTGYISAPAAGCSPCRCCRSSPPSPRSTSAPSRRPASAATCARAVFHRVGEFSAREVTRFGAPTLISRNTNDVTQVQMLVFMVPR